MINSIVQKLNCNLIEIVSFFPQCEILIWSKETEIME